MTIDWTQLDPGDVPMAMNRVHHALRDSSETATVSLDPDSWPRNRVDDLLHLCGLSTSSRSVSKMVVKFVRTAPATLAADMRLLIVGVNPSPTSAETAIPFGRPGNRFWPSVVAAGLTSTERDPENLLSDGRVGMADLSKIVTRRADEVPADELSAGLARLERIVEWLQPPAITVLGVQSWRAATGDKRVSLGQQPADFAGAKLWVLPNPSGLNAHTSVSDMAERFGEVLRSIRTDE